MTAVQGTESLRAPQGALPKSTAEQAIEEQRRALRTYRMVVGGWMVLVIAFGLLQLMGVVRV
jgi:hypothetical protein